MSVCSWCLRPRQVIVWLVIWAVILHQQIHRLLVRVTILSNLVKFSFWKTVMYLAVLLFTFEHCNKTLRSHKHWSMDTLINRNTLTYIKTPPQEEGKKVWDGNGELRQAVTVQTVLMTHILCALKTEANVVHQWKQTSLLHLYGRFYDDQVIQILCAQGGGLLS